MPILSVFVSESILDSEHEFNKWPTYTSTGLSLMDCNFGHEFCATSCQKYDSTYWDMMKHWIINWIQLFKHFTSFLVMICFFNGHTKFVSISLSWLLTMWITTSRLQLLSAAFFSFWIKPTFLLIFFLPCSYINIKFSSSISFNLNIANGSLFAFVTFV